MGKQFNATQALLDVSTASSSHVAGRAVQGA